MRLVSLIRARETNTRCNSVGSDALSVIGYGGTKKRNTARGRADHGGTAQRNAGNDSATRRTARGRDLVRSWFCAGAIALIITGGCGCKERSRQTIRIETPCGVVERKVVYYSGGVMTMDAPIPPCWERKPRHFVPVCE